MTNRKYFCDECGHTFHIVGLNIRDLGQGVQQTYYACPSCKVEYSVSYTNKAIRALHERIRAKREELSHETDVERHLALADELERLIAKSTYLMTEIKHVIEKGGH